MKLARFAAAALALATSAAFTQETPVTVAISGWTGFAPLSLADKLLKAERRIG